MPDTTSGLPSWPGVSEFEVARLLRRGRARGSLTLDEVIDVVLLWWRDGDGDLVDALMDAIGPLSDDGFVWVLSPKTGLPGHVEPSEIAESAPTAGLTQTSAQNLGDWIGSRLVQPKTQATKR